MLVSAQKVEVLLVLECGIPLRSENDSVKDSPLEFPVT